MGIFATLFQSFQTNKIRIMKKIALALHRGVGMLIGVLVSLLCLTGAMMIFEDELRELASPELYFSTPPREDTAPIELSDLAQSLTLRTLGEEKRNVVSGITIPSEEGRNYIAHLERGEEMLYVNPYTGEIVERRTKRDGFFGGVMRLHRWLLDASKSWGKAIVGYGTLGFLLVLLSGLIVWLPKGRKALRPSLTVKTTASRPRLLYDLHRSLGIYVLIPLLVIATTGLNWSFPWWRSGLYGIFSTEYPQKKSQPSAESEAELPTINYAQWATVARQLRAQYPESRSIRVGAGKAEVSICGFFGNPRAVDKVTFDPNSGEITKITPYAEESRGQRVRGWIYALHTGSWGGWLSKLLTLIVVLIGATLPWTGMYIMNRKKTAKSSRHSQ